MPAVNDAAVERDLGATFLMSVEQELMTVVRPPELTSPILQRVLRRMAGLAPSLPDLSNGFFNAYGRVYVDLHCHLELAALECDDPYQLALLVETQQALLARAVAEEASPEVRVVLANNNHDGLLQATSATWGAHENYLVTRHPPTFAEEIMPFLVTRTFAGAGGVRFPAGELVAGVRPLFMQHETGGDTTSQRAIHSTSREEHLVGPRKGLFRYHLIVGDSHRCQFNLALQLGATALVLRVLETEGAFLLRVRELCARLRLPLGGSWLRMLATCNHLANAGEAPRVHPCVLEVQAFYLDAARRFARSATAPPAWVARCLQDWGDTLDAMARGDDDWLAARLDTFVKRRLLASVLAARGLSWSDLRGDKRRFGALTLVEHSFHDVVGAASTFRRLEQSEVVRHRVGAMHVAGSEAEAYVPAVGTRARARARFLVDHRGTQGMRADWGHVIDDAGRRYRRLDDPFATEFGPWEPLR